MRKEVVTLLRRYVAAAHPAATDRPRHLKKAKAFWRSLPTSERGKFRRKIEAIIAKRGI